MVFEITPPANEAGTLILSVYGASVAYTPAAVSAKTPPVEISVALMDHALTASAVASVALSV
jgi:hypothetical protein